MLRFAHHKPYVSWTLICLVGELALGIWGYWEMSAKFAMEPGLTGEMLAREEHHRDETAMAAAVGSFAMCVPAMMLGFIVIWSALRWR